MPMNTMRGFTLIELMIGLAIVGILVFVGLPEFSIMMANIQIRAAAEAMTNGMQTARGEAVQRNGSVQFVLGTQSGYQVIEVSTGTVIRNRSQNEGSRTAAVAVTPAGATQVTFSSLGQIVTNPDGSAPIQQVDVTSGSVPVNTRPMRVIVANNVRMCDPAVAAGDTRACP
jgi:type IV fimbrial biogenesis protein FimT